jgi:hypothetical protein
LSGGRSARECQRDENALDGDEAIARFAGNLFGGIEQAHRIIVEIGRSLCAAARYSRDFRQSRVHGLLRNRRIAAGPLNQSAGHAFGVFEQGLQHVLGGDALVIEPDRQGLRGLQEPLGAVGEFFEVHGINLLLRREIVLPLSNTRG